MLCGRDAALQDDSKRLARQRTKQAERGRGLVDQVTEVRSYYEANTPAFERYSQSGSGLAIRRAVWGPSVNTRLEAFQYVDSLIAEEAESLRSKFGDPLRVCDFGCGVGTSLLFLASRMPIDGTGVTISPLQARTSNDRFRQSGFGERLRCIEGDFLSAAPNIGAAHVVLSIEAFVHSSEPEAFFERPHSVLHRADYSSSVTMSCLSARSKVFLAANSGC